jgi:3-hydroxy acid dehydrogenase / malonic semialdehyde reductase
MPQSPVEALAGRKVLITGAAGAVGRAVAERMAAAGARLLLADRTEADLGRVAEEITRGGPAATHWVTADLSTRQGVAAVFQEVDSWLGGIDLLVACAGVGSGPLMEMDDDAWRFVIDANLASYVACTRFAIDRMRQSGRDDCLVILVGSISVHIKAVGESVYNASKGGVASFAETLRKEMIPERIRVTLIEPGAIGSAMQPFSPEERAALIRDHKLLPPAEVADAIMFAATRAPGVDIVTLRIEPLDQKIY